MRFLFSLTAATAAAILFLGCGSTEEATQPQGLVVTPTPTAAVTPTPTADVAPTATAVATPTATVAPVGTPTPTAVPLLNAWPVFADAEDGFSIRVPPSSTRVEQAVDYGERVNLPAFTGRSILFRIKSGDPAVSMVIAPNPGQLTLTQWIETYPGWSSEPTEIAVAGELGLLFPIDVLGSANPTVYFMRGGKIFGIRGNVVGGEGSAPGITALEFDQLVEDLEFDAP